LPDLHKDPFDRILVAQALADGLTLRSKDAMLRPAARHAGYFFLLAVVGPLLFRTLLKAQVCF
jgi:hypothetical protein